MIPNPLKLKLQSKRNLLIDEKPMRQVGTNADFFNLYPFYQPADRGTAPETLTDTNTIFISNSAGNDGWAGTTAAPVKTIKQAVINALANSAIGYFCFLATTYTYVEKAEDAYIPAKYSIYNDTGISSVVRSCYGNTGVSSAPAANSYFIDFKNGLDTNAGTQLLPVKTLQKASDLAFAAGAVGKKLVILVDDTYSVDDYTSEESVEIIVPSYGGPGTVPRDVCVAWREGVDTFKGGVTAQLKYKYLERDTASPIINWMGAYSSFGNFQQGGLETLYAFGQNGGYGQVYYSTDGINFTLSQTLSAAYAYCMLKYGTNLYCGTNTGVWVSATGNIGSWVSSKPTNAYYKFIEFNGELIAGGYQDVARFNGATWNVIETCYNLHSIIAWGNRLYYAAHNVLKYANTSWATATATTITEVSYVDFTILLGDYLYLLGINTTTNMQYFIRVDSSHNYEIIASWEFTANPRATMNTIDDRIYMFRVYDDDALYTFDGNSFLKIGDLPDGNNRVRGFFSFKNRYYYAALAPTTLKYGLLDALSVWTENGYGRSLTTGLIVDGNQEKARNCLNYYRPPPDGQLVMDQCQLRNAFYRTIDIEHNIIANSIIRDSKNGGFVQTARACLIYNIENVVIHGRLDRCTIDNATSVETNYVLGCIFSRCPTRKYEGTGLIIKDSVVEPPANTGDSNSYNNTLAAVPLFRNRDAFNQQFPDYRLQAKWMHPKNSELYYKINSPGVDHYQFTPTDPIIDAGCYAFERTIENNGWDLEWGCDFFPDLTIYDIQFKNINQFITVAGIKQTAHIGEQNRLVFSWIPNTAEEWESLLDLHDIFRNNEKILLTLNHWDDYSTSDMLTYAQNNDCGIFSAPSVIGSGAWKARFNPTDMILEYNEQNWRVNEFRGWLVYISYDDAGIRKNFYLKIWKNTSNTLYLKNIDNLVSLPTATIDNSADDMIFIIGAMYVRCNVENLENNLAMLYRKASAPLGNISLEFLEV